MKKLLIMTAIIMTVLIAGFFLLNSYIYHQKQAPTNENISSYEECVAAGYPILESYPEQCNTPDGKHFVRQLP